MPRGHGLAGGEAGLLLGALLREAVGSVVFPYASDVQEQARRAGY